MRGKISSFDIGNLIIIINTHTTSCGSRLSRFVQIQAFFSDSFTIGLLWHVVWRRLDESCRHWSSKDQVLFWWSSLHRDSETSLYSSSAFQRVLLYLLFYARHTLHRSERLCIWLSGKTMKRLHKERESCARSNFMLKDGPGKSFDLRRARKLVCLLSQKKVAARTSAVALSHAYTSIVDYLLAVAHPPPMHAATVEACCRLTLVT